MTVETTEEESTVEVDTVSHFIETYKVLDADIRRLTEMKDAVRREIELALGDNVVGTVKGRKTVRHSRFIQRRLSTQLVRKKYTPDELADCFIEIAQSRFSVYADGN